MSRANAEKLFGKDRATPDSRPEGRPLIHCAAELNTSHALLLAIIYTATLERGRSRVIWDDLQPDVEEMAIQLWYRPTANDVGRICRQFSPNSSYRDFLIWNGRKLTDLAVLLEPEKFIESVQTQNTDEILLDAILHVACCTLGANDSNVPVANMEFEAMRIHSDPSGTDLDEIYAYFEHNYIQGFEDIRWNEESLGEVYGRIKNREWQLDKSEMMSAGIDRLGLNDSTRKCLESAGLVTVGDLVQKSSKEILAIAGFDRESYSEVRNILDSMGLTFGLNAENRQETDMIDVKELKSVELLMTRIEDLNLSDQTVKRFESTEEHDFVYLGDVLRKTENDLLRLQYIGRRSLNDIKDNLLAGTELHFGMEFDESLSFGPKRDVSESGPDL